MSLFRKLIDLAGYDTVQVFGDSGSGKTTFVTQIAKDAVQEGKKVVFIDSERNINADSFPENFTYFYSPRLADILNRCANLPAADVYILDSIGFPVVTQFSLADMKKRGDMLLKCVTLTHFLKAATWKNKAIAIVTNQPQSAFGKNIGLDERNPFGDKAMYGYKEIWRTFLEKAGSTETICTIKAWRSRKFGRGKELFQIKISDDGVQIQPMI
jgi:RecA/RadA recombinase